jgi:hypothetical protein
MRNKRDLLKEMKIDLFLWFCKIFHLKFYAKQNYPPLNDGYDSFHLKDPTKAYFYGTVREFNYFHHRQPF